MKKHFLFLLISLLGFAQTSFAQNDTLAELFRNSYRVFELQRNNIGIYRDSKLFDPQAADFHPSSVANIGMGLIALCIADTMQWIDDAEEQAMITLQSILGETPGFRPDRNASGFFRHFIDMNTGQQAWGSEYSTIDTGILMCGALFVKKYFANNATIANYVEQLWTSINWSKAIANATDGSIYLTMNPNGEGTSGALTLPFNEYMIVAWLAMKSEGNMPGIATELWNNWYSDPSQLPINTYLGIPLLTDGPSRFLSSFVPQFCYYLCQPFRSNPEYISYLENAREADSLWWANRSFIASAIWGLGAGSANFSFGYNADAINSNPSNIYSPHIIGGFLPVHEAGKENLLRLWLDGDSKYKLPGSGNHQILWRKSLNDPQWNAGEVQGIDYSTMLFGLASLPEFLGPEFFEEFGDFDFPGDVGVGVAEGLGDGIVVEVFPVPFKDLLQVRVEGLGNRALELSMFDLRGRKVLNRQLDFNAQSYGFEFDMKDLASGVWILGIEMEGRLHYRRLVKL